MNEETLAVESLRFELQVPPEVPVPQALPDQRVWTQGELQTEVTEEKNRLPEFMPWSGFAWKLLPGEPAQEQAVLPAKAEAAGASAASRPN